MTLAPLSAGTCRTGFVILTAQPMAGHDAEGQRREPRPGRSRCRRRPGPGSGPETGASPDHRRAHTPAAGHAGGTPRQNRPPLRSSKRLPGTSVSLPGITLSDEGGQGERARTRRYARQPAQPPWRWMTHRKNNLWRPNRTLGIELIPGGFPGRRPADGNLPPEPCR